MLKSLYCFLYFSFLLLQACSQQSSLQESHLSENLKQKKAAVYNTQLGLLYLKKGDKQRAKQKIVMALQLAPRLADANLAFAYLLEKNGQMKKAEFYYKKALALEPHNGIMLNNYGAFLCRRGSYRNAEQYFLKAVDDIAYLDTASAYENAGLCFAAVADNKKAAYYFRRALKEDSTRKQSFYELVNLELNNKKYEKAFESVQKYLKPFENDKDVLEFAELVTKKANKEKMNIRRV